MKTKYFILAAMTSIALASCSSDEYVGDTSPTNTSQEAANEGAIVIGGNAGRLTRATSNTGTVAQMLDGQMKIYGVKNVGGYTDVFQNYILWDASTATTSNPDGDWEYVGESSQTYGSESATIGAAQTIKYWDYSAENYHFVAGSPVASFTYALDGTSKDIKTATVTGLAGHITANPSGTAITTNPVYIADPVNVPKASFKNEVQFSFKRQQSFVRVGIFETIPGYSITDIKFYAYGSSGWESTADANHNIILASTTAEYFQGSGDATATVTYDWTGATPSYTYEYTASSLTRTKNWYAGALASGVQATTSTESAVDKLYGTDNDMGSNGYFTVIPSATALTAAPILIKCDYTLTADDGNGETINVKGATAAIPTAFTYWKPNTSYTYLFKISDNTNGTTGTPDTDLEGLFPITFDAVVEAEEDGNKLGAITIVNTPSITTYQAESVTDKGIKYVKDKVIYFTAQNDETGALFTLTTGGSAVSNVQVYKLAAAATEADLQLTAPSTTVTTTILGSAAEVGKWTVPAGSGSFTPTETGYYAIQYRTSATPEAYAYKVVHVED